MRGISKKQIKVMGIDLSKSTFYVYGEDKKGERVISKSFGRKAFTEWIVNLPPCLVGIEACGSSHYWARKIQEMGHEVKLMAPQFVKPFVKSNKNDAKDAEAICEASQRPNMRFVSPKSKEQQDALLWHRIRERLVRQRTALINEIRGLLFEYGFVIGKTPAVLRRKLPLILRETENELTPIGRRAFLLLFEEWTILDKKISSCETEILNRAKWSERCKKLMKIPGVGILTASAVEATVGDARKFKNGREMSAYFGLVPLQKSSGGKTFLGRISKRGDAYIRRLCIHGGRSIVSSLRLRNEKHEKYRGLLVRRGANKTSVAIANRNLRVMWKLLTSNEEYKSSKDVLEK